MKYDKNKWSSICKTTLSNYINMEKRLTENKKFSDFILIYYSIFFIINSLTAMYFECYNIKLCEYFGMILSVVMLAYSFINSSANYAARIDKVTKAINDLKTLKRKSLIDEDIEAFTKEYNEIVDNVEFRNDVDFFKTVKSQCKENGIDWYRKFDTEKNPEKGQLKNYLSEISPMYLQFKIFLTWCLKILVVVLPILVVAICFFIK